MINDIKMDSLGVQTAPTAGSQNTAQPAVSTAKQAGVTVTNQLDKLHQILASSSDELSAKDSNAVNDMKLRIQNNQYKVDFNALSDKLISSGALIEG